MFLFMLNMIEEYCDENIKNWKGNIKPFFLMMIDGLYKRKFISK